MKRFGIGMLTLVVALSFSPVWACDKDGSSATTASAIPCGQGKVAAQTASAKSGCPKGVCPKAVEAGVARVMKTMPKLAYKVGELETPCGKTARAKAQASGATVAYVVAGETFATKTAAMDRLAELMTAELPKVMTVAYTVGDEVTLCPKNAAKLASEKHQEATPMVAGIPFESAEKAQAVAERLAAKMKTLTASDTSASPRGLRCSKSGCAKTAATAPGRCTKGGCTKGGCTKSGCAKGGCAKGGCTKSGCAKAKAANVQTASLKPGCCSKGQTRTASVKGSVSRDEDTPALANAKRMVRQIVEFVVASQAS